MPLINLRIQHGRTQEEARRRLDTAVQEVSTQLGRMLRRVEWAADRNRVKLEGVGFWVEMWVDAQAVQLRATFRSWAGCLAVRSLRD